nr:YfiR family protein [uncultured Carboxylicivirga sp.]
MKKHILILLLLFLAGTSEEAFCQMTKFKALFLYNFTQNVEWPPNTISSNEFIITVVGDDEMAGELEKLAQVKKVGSKTMVIKQTNQVKDINDSHVVFLSSTKSDLMSRLAIQQEGQPVLLISSKEGLCKDGAAICFTTVDGKLRYQINEDNINARSLKVNNKLISLGISTN